MQSLSATRIAFIGGGNMAQALMIGLQQRAFAMHNITVIDPDTAKHEHLQATLGVNTSASLTTGSLAVDVVVLAVKPQQLHSAAQALGPLLQSQLVVSVAAGIRTADLRRWLNGYKTIIRTMPNTPAQIQSGITGAYALSDVTQAQREIADAMLQAAGEVVWLADEDKLDAVTAISGSGPAYVFLMIEALTAAGVSLGLSEEQSLKLSLATFKGASLLAAGSTTPVSTLHEQVTSKGGTTEQGLLSMHQHDIHGMMRHAAEQAARRAKELGDQLGAQA
jgi:pyrroline-5-carboxylate reductase